MSTSTRARSLPGRLAIGAAWFLAALFILGLAVWIYAVLTLGSRLEHRLAALRQRGEPTTMAEAAPKPVPAERNAAIEYQSVLKVDFTPGATLHDGMAGLTEAELREIGQFRQTPSADRLVKVRRLLAKPSVRDALARLKTASEKPKCVFPVPWQDAYAARYLHLAKFREAEHLVMSLAILSAADGKPEEAAQWLTVGLRFPRHMMQEPTLIAQLCAYAMYAIVTATLPDVLAYGDLPPAATALLQAELATVNLNAGLRPALLRDRVSSLDLYDRSWQAADTEIPSSPTAQHLGRTFLARPFWQWQQLQLLNNMEKLIPQTLKPYRETRPAQLAPADQVKRAPWDLSTYLMPVYSKVGANRDQCEARLGMMRIALTLNDYHLKHKRYPKSLSQLPPPLPQDPFSGRAFVYRPSDGHYLLYSVGQNLKDDGGKKAAKSQDRMEKGDLVWGQ